MDQRPRDLPPRTGWDDIKRREDGSWSVLPILLVVAILAIGAWLLFAGGGTPTTTTTTSQNAPSSAPGAAPPSAAPPSATPAPTPTTPPSNNAPAPASKP